MGRLIGVLVVATVAVLIYYLGVYIGGRHEKRRYRRIGNVCDAGGGHVQIYVDRDLDDYPELGAAAFVLRPKENP